MKRLIIIVFLSTLMGCSNNSHDCFLPEESLIKLFTAATFSYPKQVCFDVNIADKSNKELSGTYCIINVRKSK